MNIRSRIQQLERKLTPKHSPPEIVIVSTEEDVAAWHQRHPGEPAIFIHTQPPEQQRSER
jgi:hypothetical protein